MASRAALIIIISILIPTSVIHNEQTTDAAPPAEAATEVTDTAAEDITAEPELDPHGIYGADPAFEVEIVETIAMFDRSGLTLPELRIYVHDSQEPCGDNLGLYSKGGDPHRIDVCNHSTRLVMHELAHVWEYHNMDDSTRRAFMERSGAKVWNDHSVVHPARGVEQVADAIKWGLDSAPIQSMSMNYYAEDLERFELLTGVASPRIAHLADEAHVARRFAATVTASSGAADLGRE